MNKVLSSVILLSLSMGQAYAASPVSTVGGARVTKDKLTLEARVGYREADDQPSNDGRVQLRQHMDYGVNDWYAIRFILAQDIRQDESLEHASVTLEQRFQLLNRKEHGFDGGLRLTYKQSDGDKLPHKVGVTAIADVPLGEGWRFRHHSIIDHDLGHGSTDGLAYEIRHQLTKKIKWNYGPIESVRVGAAMFHDFGRLRDLSGYSDQVHQLRPIIQLSSSDAYVKLGYGIGLSKGSDDQSVMFSLGTSF